MACNCDNCGGQIVGLAHIGVRVSDMEKSIKFYTEVLGFELTSQQILGTSHLAFLNIGTCLIELIHPANYVAREAGQIDHIAMEVKDIDMLVCRLIEKGVPFLSNSINDAKDLLDGVKNIFFTGPDGERFEFFEYYNRK
ncbi:MAG: VOC family protein [Clostridia bacterium]|nr:VOC family protein [Clostridia bacterium]